MNLLLHVGHSAAIFANSLMSSISDSILFVILSILASSVIIIVGLKLDIKGVDKPTRSISKRDKDVFRNIFWARVSDEILIPLSLSLM